MSPLETCSFAYVHISATSSSCLCACDCVEKNLASYPSPYLSSPITTTTPPSNPARNRRTPHTARYNNSSKRDRSNRSHDDVQLCPDGVLGSHVPCGIDLRFRSVGTGGSCFGPRDVSSSITVYIPSGTQVRRGARRSRWGKGRGRASTRRRRRFRG